MGLFLDKPKKEKERDSGEGNGLRYAVCAMQGWRVDMEDSHSVKLGLAPWLKNFSYFAVFDGHAGDFVSKYCSIYLIDEVMKGITSFLKLNEGGNQVSVEMHPMDTEETEGSRSLSLDTERSLSTNNDSQIVQDIKESSSAPASLDVQKREGIDNVNLSENSNSSVSQNENEERTFDISAGKDDQKMDSELHTGEEEDLEDKLDNVILKSIICKGFLDMDERLKALPEFNAGEERSGSTAIAVFVSSKQYIFANCGDSRALLCRNGKPFFVTLDHKPYHEEEKTRIEKAGGSVIIQRVNGSLAVSRSLGDFDYKRVPDTPCTAQLVSAEPELTFVDRADDDEFLVLACDGVWDVMSNEDVVGYVQSRLKVRQDLDSVCDDLLETCLAKGSKDNMSVIIVTFPGAPVFCEEEAAKETQVNEIIKQKVEEVVKKYDSSIDIESVFEALQREDIGGLPPGGGLPAKLPLIEQLLEHLIPEQVKNENQRYAGSVPDPVTMMKQFGGDASVGPSEEAEGPAS